MELKSLLCLLLLQMTAVLSCPDLWIQVNDHCYMTSTEKYDWYESQQFCVDQGGYLIEINDDDEQASLYSFLSGDLNYWIGLADFATEGVFVWQHSYDEATYFYWGSGEPNDQDGDEDCVHLRSSSSFAWNDGDCYKRDVDDRNIHALCETENV